MIKQPDRKFITQFQDIVSSGLPVHYIADSMAQFEALQQYSPFPFDTWLYKNAEDVINWNNQ